MSLRTVIHALEEAALVLALSLLFGVATVFDTGADPDDLP